ncbi:MAG: P-protein [Planctomycetes bacterium]|nr:P-protein [Planctomycetota bacterium]
MKIAFHGQRGSYSEAAAAWMYADQDIATVPCDTVQQVFDALADEQCQYGVVRVENSEWGTSFNILDLLRATRVYFSRDIRFHERYNLAGQKNASKGGVKRIYAHPAILNLCSTFLARQKNIELIARFDGAENLAALVQRSDKNEATVCGDFAASIFGLKVLEPSVENSVTGVTRFVALTKAKQLPPEDAADVRTSAMFELKHQPGALMSALAAFRQNEINLTQVFARPNRTNKWDYTVFVEFPGRFDQDNIRTALAELRQHTTYLQLIGSHDSVEPRIQTT